MTRVPAARILGTGDRGSRARYSRASAHTPNPPAPSSYTCKAAEERSGRPDTNSAQRLFEGLRPHRDIWRFPCDVS
jgi:hypothetical protein